jgi:hypothetical protein
LASRHYIGRQLAALGHDIRLMPAQYVKPFLKGHKNDYRDAEAIAEAVQRPTMHFVAIKTPEQMDLLALHRVRSRLVGQQTGVINQIRGSLIVRGIVRCLGSPSCTARPGHTVPPSFFITSAAWNSVVCGFPQLWTVRAPKKRLSNR